MRQFYKHKDHIGFTISIFLAKWFCSISFGFLFWSGLKTFGKFKRKEEK